MKIIGNRLILKGMQISLFYLRRHALKQLFRHDVNDYGYHVCSVQLFERSFGIQWWVTGGAE